METRKSPGRTGRPKHTRAVSVLGLLLLVGGIVPLSHATADETKDAAQSPAQSITAPPATATKQLPLAAPKQATTKRAAAPTSNYDAPAIQAELQSRRHQTTAALARPVTANAVTAAKQLAAALRDESCTHIITMWDDYGDGWNGGYIDIYINGQLSVGGVTMTGGEGPVEYEFNAATGDEVVFAWTEGEYAPEPSYCVTDVIGRELACDGLNGTTPTGVTFTGNCETIGACCDPFDATCTDDVQFADCPPPLGFTLGENCGELDPPCGDPGACCTDETATCTNGLRANCAGRFISAGECGEFAPTCGDYHACRHTIEIGSSNAFGWSGNGYIEVLVNGEVALTNLVVTHDDTPPLTYDFTAGDQDVITVAFRTNSGWEPPYNAEYCVYDGAGNLLGCDGQGGETPTGITVYGLCEGVGACCNPFDGSCTDLVNVWDCQPPMHFTNGLACEELPVPCGNPGACCNQEAGTCTDEFEANCSGRFESGAHCVDNPFTPPCGAYGTCNVLVIPADSEFEYTSDNEFMARLSEFTYSTTEMVPGTTVTPTLAELQQYDMVITHANGLYANRKTLGNNLADYVESGGKVMLGNYSDYTTGNIDWLDGRIMEDYNPAVIEDTDWGAYYQADGTSCMLAGVGPWRALPWDILIQTRGSAAMDGFYVNDSANGPSYGYTAAYRLDQTVSYVSGFMAGYLANSQEETDQARMAANFCYCEPDAALTGACCDPFAGTCTDAVSVVDCMPPLQWTEGTLCADLDEPCGNIGACCDEDTGCSEQFERNCTGRFIAGATCAEADFDPPCGVSGMYDILYAPSSGDSPQFRDELAFRLNSKCDYYDARVATPTLPELLEYEAVVTWSNYGYAGTNGELGDVLADYVDAGGKVILGMWTAPSGQNNWLEGRVMDEYNPAIVEDFRRGGGDYTGGATDCVFNGIEMYGAPLCDVITGVAPTAWYDGQLADDYGNSSIAVAFQLDRSVYYVAGFDGGTSGPGQWADLFANMMRCPESDVRGACCSFNDGGCQDNVRKQDCLPPYQWTYDTLCEDLDPQCGWPGACCDETTGECTETVFAQCEGRHLPGETCETAAFDPPCGEYEPCTHTFTAYSDYEFGWVGASVDIYVGGVIRVPGITLSSGTGPASLTFEAEDGEEITTVWHPGMYGGGYDFITSYCITAPDGTTLACDGENGSRPGGVITYGECRELTCGNGVCQLGGGENCANCPEDCGTCRCVDQPMTLTNNYFSDMDCQQCAGGGYPLQMLAEDFVAYQPTHVDSVTFWGVYSPGNETPALDNFTIEVIADSNGYPTGPQVASYGPLEASRTLLGNGKYEYIVDLNLDLPAGAYWLAIYANTVDSDETWAWSTGIADPPFGRGGGAYSVAYPAEWTVDGLVDLGFSLDCAPIQVPGDIDSDGDVDLDDFFLLNICMSGPNKPFEPDCHIANLDGDGDVDLADFAVFGRFFDPPPPPLAK